MKRRLFLLFLSVFLVGLFALLFVFTIFIEPPIKLSGIENGKVYAAHPVIHWEKSFATTRVTLNGNEINPNYAVKENGSYILKGESAFLWKKKKVSYSFEVDDKPPAEPLIKERIKPVYFKQAMFTLDKVADVTYKAALNGKEISMDQPIQQPGENTLMITATKPNGLTATRKISFSIDERIFSEKAINDFVDYYFQNDVPSIIKFTGNVAIHLDGDYNKDDVKMVEKAIKELKTFFPYKMEIQENKPNPEFKRAIKMVFTPIENFSIYSVEWDDAWGVEMEAIHNAVYGTMESFILIGTDKEITREYRNSLILHELLHAVGLSNHIESPESSPLFQYANKTVTLGDKEKMFGTLLYLGDMEPNINKEEAMKQLEPRSQ
ncbi:hypothetical protein [Neobacillus sp. NPDC093127]|uniref:hypothetical protein n=1 Tax=Neobacillus sp. NPDC093127 TaxID=3364296 RepID=UPI0037F1F1A2